MDTYYRIIMKGFVSRTSLFTQCPCLRSRVQSKKASSLNDRPTLNTLLALSSPLPSHLLKPIPLSTKHDMTFYSIPILAPLTGLIYKDLFASRVMGYFGSHSDNSLTMWTDLHMRRD